jgi:SAM-dependent methyltransferase
MMFFDLSSRGSRPCGPECGSYSICLATEMTPVFSKRSDFGPEDRHGHSIVGGRTLEIFENTPKLNSWIYSKLSGEIRGDVLEVGSGIGNLSRLIARDAERVVLTDMESHYLATLRRNFEDGERVQVARFDLEHEPPPEVAGRRFDSIVAVNVIEHLRDDRTAVLRLARLLKPGGKLLVYVPACPFAYGQIDDAIGHYRRYTAATLASLMRSAGLEPTPAHYMNFVGVFGWFFNGRILRRRTISPQQVALFERFVDILRIEDRISLPIGLGLVIHARLPSVNY